jgi:quinol monooxygenase YgiN
MVIRISWGKLRPGMWNEFERAFQAYLSAGTKPKGLRGRLLAQDSTDENAGFAISLWDSMTDMQSYLESPRHNEFVAKLQPFFVGEYKTHHCELKYADMAEGIGNGAALARAAAFQSAAPR